MVQPTAKYSSVAGSSRETPPEIHSSTNNNDDDFDPTTADECLSGRKREGGGSSVVGAAMNLFNSTVGAGVIGLGGAIAGSGGLVSIAMLLVFACLAKLSFDMVISLAVEGGRQQHASYEDLGAAAYGPVGTAAVLVFKWIFSFGCLVAYIVIVRDNFSSALQSLLHLEHPADGAAGIASFLANKKLMTVLLSTTIMLPLSLLRDMTPLVRFSAVKVGTVFLIALILVSLYFQLRHAGDTSIEDMRYEHWTSVHPSILQNCGTFVFLYVAQHTSHLVFKSLRPELRTVSSWKQVTALSMALATMFSFLIGFSAYMTFWEETDSNLFLAYPPSPLVDLARVLLCVMQLLTYPPPFFSCRELLIVSLPLRERSIEPSKDGVTADEGAPLFQNSAGLETSPWLVPGDASQLVQPFHAILTVVLWAMSLFLALSVRSLGDVLNISGSISGTLIAFVLPGLFCFKLRGYSHAALLLLGFGGVVGSIGTCNGVAQAISGGDTST